MPMSRATTHFFLPRRVVVGLARPPPGPPLLEQVVGDEVAQGQRRHLDDVDFDVDVLEVPQVRG